jgi:hypothetical protein
MSDTAGGSATARISIAVPAEFSAGAPSTEVPRSITASRAGAASQACHMNECSVFACASQEEAGISEELAQRARPVGAVSYTTGG